MQYKCIFILVYKDNMNHVNTILHTLCIWKIRKYSSYLVHMLILKTSHRMCERITHKIIFLCKKWSFPSFIFQSCAFLSHKLEILHQWERATTRLSNFSILKQSCISVYRICYVWILFLFFVWFLLFSYLLYNRRKAFEQCCQPHIC